jgi:hypothetical protein
MSGPTRKKVSNDNISPWRVRIGVRDQNGQALASIQIKPDAYYCQFVARRFADNSARRKTTRRVKLWRRKVIHTALRRHDRSKVIRIQVNPTYRDLKLRGSEPGRTRSLLRYVVPNYSIK